MSFRHESISAGLPERVLRALFLLFFLMAGAASANERLTLNFDPAWKFIKADPAGAATADFNDDGWSSVSLPHTYNDVDTFENWSLPGHRGEQNQWGGRTWYRKTFSLPETFRAGRASSNLRRRDRSPRFISTAIFWA